MIIIIIYYNWSIIMFIRRFNDFKDFKVYKKITRFRGIQNIFNTSKNKEYYIVQIISTFCSHLNHLI